MKESQRQRMKTRRQRSRRRQILLGSALAVVVIGLVGLLVFQAGKQDDHASADSPATGGVGDYIPIETIDHVPDGQPVTSPSDPPTSGTHYGVSMPAGFYQTDSPEYLDPTHDGYLIHSLEHGYIIFWYNCDLLDDESCSALQADIQAVMDEFQGVKLIAFPRPTIDVPLVMTSWGYLQKFDSFDFDLAVNFIETNRPLAPEPFGT